MPVYRPKCIACQGLGKSSRGKPCVPCKGTGYRILPTKGAKK